MIVQADQSIIGERSARHTFVMEVRTKAEGRWVNIQVYADSLSKANKAADAAGYQTAGGNTKQVR